MRDENAKAGKNAAVSGQAAIPVPMSRRVLNFVQRAWRPAASVMAVALALLIVWHTVYGRNGLMVWEQKRTEDQQLRKDIEDLQQENARLRDHVERLKSDPDAIGIVAREQLHYAKPNEVIITLPPDKPAQTPSAGTGK